MRRVKSNRCGYDGLTCTGIEDLDDMFRYKNHVFDANPNREDFPEIDWDDTEIENRFSLIDNYGNLPGQVAGFVMSLKKVFSDEGTTVPEVGECGGMYNTAKTYSNELAIANITPDDVKDSDKEEAYAYELMDNTMAGTTKAISTKYDGEPYIGNIAPIKGDDGIKDQTLYPALLEPMLHAAFDPVPVEVSPVTDFYLDGIIMALFKLNEWRGIIDTKINDIIDQLNHIAGLRNLFIETQMKGGCKDGFEIQHVKNTPLGISGLPRGPEYMCTGGTAKINGATFSCSSLTGLTAPFYVYLNIFLTADTSSFGTGYSVQSIALGTSKAGQVSVGIGGVVSCLTGDPVKHGIDKMAPRYAMWKIIQETCEIDISIYKATGQGFVYYSSSGLHIGTVAYKTCSGN